MMRPARSGQRVGSGGGDIDHHDLRWHADAHGQDRATEPAGNDEVPSIFDHMSVSVAVAIARRDHWRVAEQTDLAAVRVTRQGEGDASWHARKNVGLVRQQDHRRIVRDLGQGTVEVVHTGKAAPGRFAPAVVKGELVAKAGEPERAAVVGESHDVVLVDGHTLALECAPADYGTSACALSG